MQGASEELIVEKVRSYKPNLDELISIRIRFASQISKLYEKEEEEQQSSKHKEFEGEETASNGEKVLTSCFSPMKRGSESLQSNPPILGPPSKRLCTNSYVNHLNDSSDNDSDDTGSNYSYEEDSEEKDES